VVGLFSKGGGICKGKSRLAMCGVADLGIHEFNSTYCDFVICAGETARRYKSCYDIRSVRRLKGIN